MEHSVANTDESVTDGRLFAPAAARNGPAIVEALTPFLPASGYAVEIASGTGEHVIRLAAANPRLVWQPTEIAPDRLASIAAWTGVSGASNVASPLAFNAVSDAWDGKPANFVFLSNLLHLISPANAHLLLQNLVTMLASGGTLALYGPFKRGEAFVSDGDAEFDASLRARNLDMGYKDIGWVEEHLAGLALTKRERLSLPANNLLTVWEKP